MNVFETYSGGVPNAKQKLFHDVKPWHGSLIKGAVGGLGGGKSRCCQEEQILRCTRTPGGVSVALRKVKKKADFTLVLEYKRLLRGYARWAASQEAFIFPNGHILFVIPGADFDSVGSSQLVTFYIQEAQEIDYELFDALTQRLRSPQGLVDGVPYWCGMFDARGVSTKHWISEKFIDVAWDASRPETSRQYATNPGFVYVKFSTLDNLEVLRRDSPGYFESLVRNHKNDTKWQRVFIHGETGTEVDGEAVFPEFDPQHHVGKIEEDRTLPILIGLDFGYRNPGALFCQYTRDARFVVLRELNPKSIRRDDFQNEVEALCKSEFPDRPMTRYRFYCDPAGEQETSASTITEIESWENRFSTSLERDSSRPLIKEGHETMRNLLMTTRKHNGVLIPRLMVDESCRNLIGALGGGYTFKEGSQDAVERDNPWKPLIDCIRYIVNGIIQPGDNSFMYGGFGSEGSPTLAVY